MVSRTVVFLLGILRRGVVTGSINVHNFRWHLLLNLKVFKESHGSSSSLPQLHTFEGPWLSESQSNPALGEEPGRAGRGLLIVTVYGIRGVLLVPVSPGG